jgi:hypothetical protein
MIAADIETGIARLRDLVDAADVVVPFAGAGISTECGIPDFRSPGGLWTKYQPIAFDEFMESAEMRSESWRPAAAIWRWQACTVLGKSPQSSRRTSTICTKPRGLRPTRSWSCMAIPPMPHALIAAGAMSLPGSRRVSKRTAAHRTAIAAATSKPQQSRLARRCQKRPCGAPKRLPAPAISFSPSARLWSSGLQRVFHCSPSGAERALSFSTVRRPISTTWPISSSAPTSVRRSNPSSPTDAAQGCYAAEFARRRTQEVFALCCSFVCRFAIAASANVRLRAQYEQKTFFSRSWRMVC